MNIQVCGAKDPVNIFPSRNGMYKAEFNGHLGIGPTPGLARKSVIAQLDCEEIAGILRDRFGVKVN